MAQDDGKRSLASVHSSAPPIVERSRAKSAKGSPRTNGTLHLAVLLPTFDENCVVPKFASSMQNHRRSQHYGGLVILAFKLVPTHDNVSVGAEIIEVVGLHLSDGPTRKSLPADSVIAIRYKALFPKPLHNPALSMSQFGELASPNVKLACDNSPHWLRGLLSIAVPESS